MIARRSRRSVRARSRSLDSGLFIVASILLMYAISASPPAGLVGSASHMFASGIVGVSAGVTPNSDNSAAIQLAAKEAELNAREASFLNTQNDLERAATLRDELPIYSFLASVLLFLLIGVNFYADWRRDRRGSGGRVAAA